MEIKLREALAAYRIKSAETELIRHNENATYHVQAGDSEYVLRIHEPAKSFSLRIFDVVRHDKGKLEGETTLLSALADGGFIVQRPVENRFGKLVTVLDDGTCATLLTWLSGKTLETYDDATCRQVGELLANMHEFVRGRGDFAGLDRYYYDERILDKLGGLLAVGGEAGAFSDGMDDIMGAIAAIGRTMGKLRAQQGSFGLIHADISKGNLLMTDRGMGIKDFCLSGYGFFDMDIGMAEADMGEEIKQALFEGYSSVSGVEVNTYNAKAFVSFGVLLFLTAQWDSCMGQDWFAPAVERWRRDLFRAIALE